MLRKNELRISDRRRQDQVLQHAEGIIKWYWKAAANPPCRQREALSAPPQRSGSGRCHKTRAAPPRWAKARSPACPKNCHSGAKGISAINMLEKNRNSCEMPINNRVAGSRSSKDQAHLFGTAVAGHVDGAAQLQRQGIREVAEVADGDRHIQPQAFLLQRRSDPRSVLAGLQDPSSHGGFRQWHWVTGRGSRLS